MVLSENLISYSTVLNKQFLVLEKMEHNILFASMYVLKNNTSAKVPYIFFKDICNIKAKGKVVLARNLKSLKNKLDNTDFIDCGLDEFEGFSKLNIFKKLELNNDGFVEIELNDEYTFLTNDLYSEMPTVSFDLNAFTRINSKHSKNLYRLLSGFTNTGWVKIEEEKLFNLIGIKFKRAWDRKKALEGSMIDVAPYFKGLNYKTNMNRVGENIVHIKFKANKSK